MINFKNFKYFLRLTYIILRLLIHPLTSDEFVGLLFYGSVTSSIVFFTLLFTSLSERNSEWFYLAYDDMGVYIERERERVRGRERERESVCVRKVLARGCGMKD